RLRPGDTLLVYVTDHGSKNDKDTADNRIVLWGEKESISVKELAQLTDQLDPGVRVVALMSQCFSGSFANLMSVRARDGQPSGAGEERAELVDALLREAWHDKAAWEPEIRLLDRIAHAFGVFSPRSLAELDQQAKSLPDLAEQLRKNGGLWQATLDDLDDANLGRFLAAHPDWAPRIDDASLAVLGPEGRRGLAGALLADLAPFTRADRATDARVRVLRDKSEKASPAAYRMAARLAVGPRLP